MGTCTYTISIITDGESKFFADSEIEIPVWTIKKSLGRLEIDLGENTVYSNSTNVYWEMEPNANTIEFPDYNKFPIYYRPKPPGKIFVKFV